MTSRPVPPPAIPSHASARAALEAAKARAADRAQTTVAGRFDEPAPADTAPSRQPAPARLSEESVRGLAAAAAATSAAQQPASPEEAAPALSDRDEALRVINAALDVVEVFDDRPQNIKAIFAALKSTPPPSSADIERKRVEDALPRLDVGQYIMMGFLEQEVPVISTAAFTLRVTFRSVQDVDDAFLERELRKFRNATPPPSGVEFMRHHTRLALALQIRTYQGNRWPPIRTSAGAIDEENFAQCLDRVQRIPSQVLQRLAQHAAWFNERIEALLSDREVLTFG